MGKVMTQTEDIITRNYYVKKYYKSNKKHTCAVITIIYTQKEKLITLNIWRLRPEDWGGDKNAMFWVTQKEINNIPTY